MKVKIFEESKSFVDVTKNENEIRIKFPYQSVDDYLFYIFRRYTHISKNVNYSYEYFMNTLYKVKEMDLEFSFNYKFKDDRNNLLNALCKIPSPEYIRNYLKIYRTYKKLGIEETYIDEMFNEIWLKFLSPILFPSYNNSKSCGLDRFRELENLDNTSYSLCEKIAYNCIREMSLDILKEDFPELIENSSIKKCFEELLNYESDIDEFSDFELASLKEGLNINISLGLNDKLKVICNPKNSILFYTEQDLINDPVFKNGILENKFFKGRAEKWFDSMNKYGKLKINGELYDFEIIEDEIICRKKLDI